jgi:hypothetical protein
MTDDQFQLLIEVDGKVTQLLEIRLDHESRIRKLERFRTWAAGVGSAIIAFFSYILYPQH